MTDLADDILIHYGKKGMKWGVRNEKPTTAQIKAARVKYNQRVNEVNKAHVMLRYANSPKAKASIESTIDKYNRDLINDPDTYIANKRTRGEKVATALLVTAGLGAAAYGSIATMRLT